MAVGATIGVLVGRENTFPLPFIDHINARNIPGVRAELVKLGGSAMDEEIPYGVIVDRISHEVPYYRCYLKAAVLRGATVINDPFWWGSDDKFLENLIAEKVGVAVPKTLLLPNKAYVEGITGESLRNLTAPLDWEAMLDYVGRPAILKPAIGGGWKSVYKVNDVHDLVRAYNETGELQMILQEFIVWEQYVRCICLGRTHIRAIPYDPTAPFDRRYVLDDNYLSPDLHARVVSDALKLVNALGYDMDTVEFAIRDGVPVAIDFLNPAPDFDSFSIKQANHDWVIETMGDLVVGYAQGNDAPPSGYIWLQNPMRPSPPRSPFAPPAGSIPSILESDALASAAGAIGAVVGSAGVVAGSAANAAGAVASSARGGRSRSGSARRSAAEAPSVGPGGDGVVEENAAPPTPKGRSRKK